MKVLFVAGLFTLSVAGCATTPEAEAPAPVPKTVTMKHSANQNNPKLPPRTVQKNLFQVVVTPAQLVVNGVTIKDQLALAELLAAHNMPLVTMAVHRCVPTAYAKELLNTTQALTNVPIAYSAFGNYTDAQCQ